MASDKLSGGPNGELDYFVAHGALPGRNTVAPTACFVLVKNAGSGEADGVYRSCDRRWEDCDVYKNCYGECIISREAHVSPKTGEKKHGFVLGLDRNPLYGTRTEKMRVPAKSWRAFQGEEPVPEIEVYGTWSEACEKATRYFADEAADAAKGGHWRVVLMMSDRAFDCHTNARPKGRGDVRVGGMQWSEQLCELMGMRAEALLHMGEYKRALIDAVAGVHFVLPFEWSKARTRGITACMNLGVEERQAKLLMEEACLRTANDFPGVRDLEPWVDEMLRKARSDVLAPVVIDEEKPPDDGRLFFRVVDPDDCKLYSRPGWDAKILGERQLNDVLRGEQVVEDGKWLELHVSEPYGDIGVYKKAFAPIFTNDPEDLREETLERCHPKDYPRKTRWEEFELAVKPLGMKPPAYADVPEEYASWRDDPPPPNQKEWPYSYKHILAIATMLHGAPETAVESFLRYHWAIGFNHIFLYFDDPEDAAIHVAKHYEEQMRAKKMEGVGLTVVLMDASWWKLARETSRFFERREKSDMFEAVCAGEARGDLESKQMIVIDQAVNLAHQMGVDWFAPLDIDECIYVPQMQENSARRYFGSKARDVECVRLWNHEAISESADCRDWLRESTLFQLNPVHLRGFEPVREYDQILRRREGREFESEKPSNDTQWFRDIMAKVHIQRQQPARSMRLDLPPPPQGLPNVDRQDYPRGIKELRETFDHFNSYKGGRCVVRLEHRLPPPIPCGVHGFLADSGDMLKEIYQASKPDDAVVLHYPNASYDLWKAKYARLPEVPATKDGAPNPLRTHLASSHVVLHKTERIQDLFYKTFVGQSQYNELAYLAEHGLVIRLTKVKEKLEYFDKEREVEEELPGRQKWYSPNGMQFGR